MGGRGGGRGRGRGKGRGKGEEEGDCYLTYPFVLVIPTPYKESSSDEC